MDWLKFSGSETLLWLAFAVVSLLIVIVQVVIYAYARHQAEKKLSRAEFQAFGISLALDKPAEPDELSAEATDRHTANLKYSAVANISPGSAVNGSGADQMNRLFNLYNTQVESYQIQTQARASWSFILAMFAMFGGLGLVGWGGAQVVSGDDIKHVAAGSVVAAIGGAMGAFITKTFLDVHRLSLVQLNHYFLQPVLNSHILTAQRLADQLTDTAAKQKAYEEIIGRVSNLIRLEPDAALFDLYRYSEGAKAPREGRKGKAGKKDKADPAAKNPAASGGPRGGHGVPPALGNG